MLAHKWIIFNLRLGYSQEIWGREAVALEKQFTKKKKKKKNMILMIHCDGRVLGT